MPTASTSHSILISASPEKVYDFLSQAARAPSFIQGLSRIYNVKPAATEPGQTWNYEFDWFGMVISGESKCTRCERPKLYEFQTLTGSPSTWTYQIEPEGGEARLKFEVDYEVPANALARFASQAVFEKMNHDRAAEILQNLKTMLES